MYRHQYIHNTVHCIGICIYPLHLTTYNTHVQTSIYIHILYIHCIGICIYPLHLSIHCMYIYRCVGYLIHNGKLCRKELSIPDIPSHKLVSIFTTNCCPCTVVPPPPPPSHRAPSSLYLMYLLRN